MIELSRRVIPLLLAGALSAPAVLSAQRVVPVQEEPRHHLVFVDTDVRILDIRIPLGDTTLFHRHTRPIAYVSIGAVPVNTQALGSPWGEATAASAPAFEIGQVMWNESYPETPVSHRVTALGDGGFRLIGIENLGPGDATAARSGIGAAGPAGAEGRWFRSVNRTLGDGQTLSWAPHDRPVVAVLVTPGRMVVRSAGGAVETVEGRGAFTVLSPGRSAELVNAGSGDLGIAVVEVR